MIVYPNNDARRPFPSTVAPLRRVGNHYDEENLQHIEEEATPEMLQALRNRITASEGTASWYYDRNKQAFDYWHARWANQTVDGLKWPAQVDGQIWPWPGASDTRVRTTEMVINEKLLVCMFALMNMKVQAVSSRPLQSMRESQQATQLLNWQIFTHMSEEFYRELRFLMNWRNALGGSIMETTWYQERRLYMQPINLLNLQALAQQQGAQASAMLDQFINDLFDPAGEENAIQLVRSASMDTDGKSFISKPDARKILKDLRDMRTAEIPIPEVCVSQPRWMALRPMIDILFPRRMYDIQVSPWVSRVEFVTETTLTDRIVTAGYDEDFVDQAIERSPSDRPQSAFDWRLKYVGPTNGTIPGYHGNDDDDECNIRLEHFYRRGLIDGVPVVYCTVFHQDVEIAAKHEPLEYEHGKYPFALFRNEHHDRPFLDSRGDSEIVYTWEQEIKKQCDMRADRTDLALKPPLETTYEDLLKMKTQFMPGTIIPTRRHDDSRWFPAPPYDAGSVEIENNIMARVDRFYPFFNDQRPTLAKLAQQGLADDVLMEMKPVIQQTWQLMQQYLPDEVVAMVIGPQQQPFNPGRKAIKGQYTITATVDMRTLDADFLKSMLGYISQLAALDTTGSLDRNKLVKIGAEAISYEVAEAVQTSEVATQKEVESEMQAFDLIVASGADQPMPLGANYQLRLQTMQQKMQSAQQNPAQSKVIQNNPEVLKVLETRMNFLQRQIQQQENAQVGRMQVTQTFNKQAPMASASPMGMGV